MFRAINLRYLKYDFNLKINLYPLKDCKLQFSKDH